MSRLLHAAARADLRQAAQAVLDAWDSPLWKTGTTAAKIADLRAALAREHAMHDLARLGQEIEQQAEPVAWAVQGCSKMWRGEFAEIDAKAEAKRIGGTCVAYPLYTTPPQRQWVGLTDEDVNRESAPIASQMKLAFHAGMYVAQKILKERNND